MLFTGLLLLILAVIVGQYYLDSRRRRCLGTANGELGNYYPAEVPVLCQQGWVWLSQMLPICWLLFDRNLRLCHFSDNAEQIFPLVRQDGLSLIELTHSVELQNLAARVLNKQNTGDFSWSRQSDQRIFKIKLLAIPSALPQRAALLLTFVDISYLCQLEKQRDDFIAEFCHQLNSPIATIMLGLEVLANPQDKGIAEVLPVIRRQLDWLHRLFRQLIELAKITDAASLDYQQLNSLELLQQLQLDFQLVAENKNAVLTVSGDNLTFCGDKHRLLQALGNLLDNAIKYGGDNNLIVLSSQKVDCRLRLEVKDSGCGLTLTDQQLIRRRFYRLNREQLGFGLGLSISEGIARAHRGELLLSSLLGQGTTVAVEIPFNLSALPAKSATAASGERAAD